jgi:hypothetical protein
MKSSKVSQNVPKEAYSRPADSGQRRQTSVVPQHAVAIGHSSNSCQTDQGPDMGVSTARWLQKPKLVSLTWLCERCVELVPDGPCHRAFPVGVMGRVAAFWV